MYVIFPQREFIAHWVIMMSCNIFIVITSLVFWLKYLQGKNFIAKVPYLFICFFFYSLMRLCCPSLKTNDYCAIPQELKDQLSERYPGARKAYLKTGRDFPFLSRSDEVNLHLQVLTPSLCKRYFFYSNWCECKTRVSTGICNVTATLATSWSRSSTRLGQEHSQGR